MKILKKYAPIVALAILGAVIAVVAPEIFVELLKEVLVGTTVLVITGNMTSKEKIKTNAMSKYAFERAA